MLGRGRISIVGVTAKNVDYAAIRISCIVRDTLSRLRSLLPTDSLFLVYKEPLAR